ncbi:DUF4139 domain-containing protein [Eisenibacter elegans]|jgi:uncharacterized protein (TIGR02231 family)|uniref:DUF4139 domain-containing protein n=1 Tax=Eisenibacter elegans TaxID=997 RepID=UPI0003FE3B67|nr:DUF4139 domain-containing protein [Eisenibacter elegans]
MKALTQTLASILIALLLAPFAWATPTPPYIDNERNVRSEVKEVTVFLNFAQVTNKATINLSAGTTVLIFEELSTKIDKNSIQVAAQGNITIMAVKPRINFLKEYRHSSRLKALEDSLEHFEDRLARVQIQQNTLQKEEDMILANQKIATEGVEVNAQKLQQMAEFYRSRLVEIQNKKLDYTKQAQKLQNTVDKLKKQVTMEKQQLNQPTSEVMVTVTAKAPVQAQFELNYIVADAGWIPVYDLRAIDASSPIQLTYKAEVFQNTGVDWENVKITLSTGNPAQSGQKPTLSPWWVDFYRQQVYQTRAAAARSMDVNKKSGVMRSSEEYAANSEDMFASPIMEAESVAQYTTVAESTFSTEFDIALPYTIRSNSKGQMVDVQVYTLPTEYHYSTVPRLDKDAFLMTRLTGWEEYSLMPGLANVYFEGRFVGETTLSPGQTKDTLDISLGRDKRIIIQRDKIQDFYTKKTLGANIKEEQGFAINLRNTKRQAITLTVEEQIPVSKNNQITVELIEAEGAQYNPKTGMVTWKVTLQPNETKNLTLKYSLKYPKNEQIQY